MKPQDCCLSPSCKSYGSLWMIESWQRLFRHESKRRTDRRTSPSRVVHGFFYGIWRMAAGSKDPQVKCWRYERSFFKNKCLYNFVYFKYTSMLMHLFILIMTVWSHIFLVHWHLYLFLGKTSPFIHDSMNGCGWEISLPSKGRDLAMINQDKWEWRKPSTEPGWYTFTCPETKPWKYEVLGDAFFPFQI